MNFKKIFQSFLFQLPQKTVTAKCGHETRREDSVTAFGVTVTCKVPLDKDGKIEYCHRCLEKMIIRCAWCGRPIFIGDPVTLYVQLDENTKMPEYAVPYNDEGIFVGCLNSACAESGADRQGFWYPPGKVLRVLSPLEQCLQSGEMVIVKDICDISQAILVREE